ncbi:type IV pilus assembly protein FimV [Methylogaea oryzae]|uniref:FimV N-terminal domain-containing protein n=2 Tax=Methylogaea oryzae TaxID=1295382 RepID=A0A8D4VNA5_9GAMM|nr:hypothetical protein [Methylogaea oryzae]BBL71028.1 hypothetical protein MoryE10_16340 [Methylogaea oryzae]
MPKPLKYASAALGLLAPMAAHALNVGEMEVRSALDRRFEAEIPLALEAGESAKNLRAGLGSPEAFAEAKIPRPAYLSDFRFELAEKNGRPVLRISSEHAVKETYLTLLLQLESPKGTLLRKFNVVLDPPSPQRNNAVSTAAAPQTAVPTRRYGPVKHGDSLWTIAKRVSKDQRIPLTQAIALLHDANPQAFVNGQRNAIKLGAVLNLPMRPNPAKPGNPPSAQPRPEASLKLLGPQENRPPQSAAEAAMREKMEATAAQKALKLAEEAQQESDDNRSYLARLEQQMAKLRQSLMSNAAKPAAAAAPPAPAKVAAAAAPALPTPKPARAAAAASKPADKAKDGKRKARQRRQASSRDAAKKS